ncbi:MULTISPECIES: hypothetical protein [Clostridia]|jgi:uncharacterized membrane protein|uniref:putative ABC transporter permease n=1 Tax=Clostridia TaxID=186801 RepID=UPI000E49700D|nr:MULTISPECIES: hypothetical protein [Clostridia]RHS40167.1 hypothetical protein DWV17_11280 [Clostridium sp. AF02-29]
MRNLLCKYLSLFGIGGVLYVLLEHLWRGYSHWTMFVLGGVSFVFLGLINEIIPWQMLLWKQMLIGTAGITTLEFVTGCIVNLWLGWHVWDYSGMPGNILGQICPQYTILWILVSLAGIVLDDWIRFLFFDEDRPHYKI